MTPEAARIAEALADASRLRHTLTGARFAVAYGSHARGTGSGSSDLDLLFVGDTPLDDERGAWLTTQVKLLHHRHGLSLDEEVSYEVKLYATATEITDAASFGGYRVDAAGILTVPPVLVQPAYLNSAGFKCRLLVNALTSPHVFLGGDVGYYRACRARLERTVALLALSLLEDQDTLTVTEAVTALISDPGTGRNGEDFLGYTGADRPFLYGLVQASFAELADHDVLRALNGSTFNQHRLARRALVATTAIRPRLATSRIGGLPNQTAR